MQIEILYQDDDLVVINKPPGVVVNRAATIKVPTLQDWMGELLMNEGAGGKEVTDATWQMLVPADFDATFGTPADIFAQRQGIVHRLDKDTSGVMVLAKNPGALVALLRQFKHRQTEKKYLALVHGKFAVPEAVVNAPLGRASQDRKLFSVKAGGREAVTTYKVQREYKEVNQLELTARQPDLTNQTVRRFSIYQGFSLVACWPKTGRTHQIRVHMAHLQHPLVGDLTYVGKKRKSLDPVWCPRQFLHAESLEFTHPRTGERMTISAPLTPDLQAVLDLLL